MKRIPALSILMGMVILPAVAWSSAFEEHTSWQKEPRLETEKGISVGRSVLEMGVDFRYLYSSAFFNSYGNIDQSPTEYQIEVMDLFGKFGFTDNWTLWGNIPIVWMQERTLQPKRDEAGNVVVDASGEAILEMQTGRENKGEIGDCEAGILYQFYRRHDPTLSLGIALRWKLPTGQEAPGGNKYNITGTGTTDVELSFLGRAQLLRYLSLGFNTGYNIRFPGFVQYLSDRHTYITNAALDLGDEIFIRGEITAGIEQVALRLTGEFRYRFATQIAMPNYMVEKLKWKNPKTGLEEEEEYMLYNGATYQDWDVHELLDPSMPLVSSAGYLLSLTPHLIVRPHEMVDVSVFARFHFIGQNSIFVTDKDGNNSSFNNFMPMQALGQNIGDVFILGELGAAATFRW